MKFAPRDRRGAVIHQLPLRQTLIRARQGETFGWKIVPWIDVN